MKQLKRSQLMNNLVTIENIKKIRDLTGGGLTEIKQALSESQNFNQALAIMKSKAMARVGKRQSRTAQAGLIYSYIHNGRIGVLIEVNCETEFVAKTDDFKNLVKDLALQIAASPASYIKDDDIPQDVINKYEQALKEETNLENIPADQLELVIKGKLDKIKSEISLMSQDFNKDPDISIDELIKTVAAKLGEKIIIAKFVRFELGQDGVEASFNSED